MNTPSVEDDVVPTGSRWLWILIACTASMLVPALFLAVAGRVPAPAVGACTPCQEHAQAAAGR